MAIAVCHSVCVDSGEHVVTGQEERGEINGFAFSTLQWVLMIYPRSRNNYSVAVGLAILTWPLT